ncbi:TonB-dependent receptor [Gaoshiqia sp. Z1-71]|uniref:TonB-dependent receptor n=1 Tax=Gaoshiqia hydrogeniformans TaxID=3290090 RepID=UPI003BF7A968
MKKKLILAGTRKSHAIKQLMSVMKITVFLIVFSVVSVMANSGHSQEARLTVQLKNASLGEILNNIEDNTNYYFMYNNELVDLSKKVTIDVQNKSLEEVLTMLFEETGINYKIYNRQVVLSPTTAKGTDLSFQQQSLDVSGRVTDSFGGPLPGVTVVIKGTARGIITDIDGKYSLEDVPGDAVLVFSFVGMKMTEIEVAGRSTIDVTMKEEAIGLEEVVAVGYGVQKKKLVTGATVQVKGEELARMVTPNVMDAMKGQTPGVRISSASAQPGESPKIVIRGMGTVNNASPLYVVDGVQTGDISYLNSNDIESLDILKDAASAAIYGVNGANGVILITTKTGKTGKAQISYDGYLGVQNLYKKMPYLNAQEYATIMNEQNINSGRPAVFPTDAESMAALGEGTDWIDELVSKDALMQNHSLAFSGGTDQSVYSMGLSYTGQDGIIGGSKKSGYDRYTFRVNTEHKLWKNYIKAGQHLTYTNTAKKGVSTNNLYDNILGKGYFTSPLIAPDDADGYLNPAGSRETSPVLFMKYNYNNINKEDKIIGDVYLEVEPVKGLTMKSTFAMDFASGSYRNYTPVYNIGFETRNDISSVRQNMWNHKVMTWENTVHYVTSFGKHHLDGLLGMSARRNTGESIQAVKTELLIDDFEYAWLSNAKGASILEGDITGGPDDTERLISYFGRVNYDFNEKYLFTAILRADGTTRFAPQNRWGYFPSFSAGWVVTNEEFMKSASTWMDFLKLRASWGQNGNQNFPNYQWMATLTTQNGGYSFGSQEGLLTTGIYAKKLSNPDLKWEISKQLNIGLDARFLNGKLDATLEYYSKTTKDWIVDAPVAAISGAEAPFINGGSVTNKGVELSLGFNNKVRDFSYHVNANITYNKNKVTEIQNAAGFFEGGGNLLYTNAANFFRVEPGRPIGYFYGLKTDGIFQNEAEIQNYQSADGTVIQPLAEAGDIKFVDVNLDGKIDEKDRTMIGSPIPDYILGFSFGAEYKGFDLSVTTQGQFGQQIAMGFIHNYNGLQSNYHQVYLNRWHGEGTSNYWPRVTNNTEGNRNWTYMNDLLITDGDYLKISNVTIGYDFRKVWKKCPLSQMRLYFTAQNLYTFTKYIGMDPEVGFGVDDNAGHSYATGIDVGYYPHPRNYLIGLNLKF